MKDLFRFKIWWCRPSQWGRLSRWNDSWLWWWEHEAAYSHLGGSGNKERWMLLSIWLSPTSFSSFFPLIISVSLTVSVSLSPLCVHECESVSVCVYLCVCERRHMSQHKCEGKRTLKSWLFPSTVKSNSTGLWDKCLNQVSHLDSLYFPFIHSETLNHLNFFQLNLPEIVLTPRSMPLLP